MSGKRRQFASGGARWLASVALATLIPLAACRSSQDFYFGGDSDLAHYRGVATSLEEPTVDTDPHPEYLSPPRMIDDGRPPEYWDISLEETINVALANSRVMRAAGGRIVEYPDAARTVYDPALSESNPIFGQQAALSAFDAQVSSSLILNKNNRVVNNSILGGGTNFLQQDLSEFQAQVAKTAATGTQFAFRNNTIYDANNRPFNLFPSSYDTNFEAEFKHPLLRGGGIGFNRIAGPNNPMGFYNGVVIARIRTDIALADFEESVGTLLMDVERSYWTLYFAYRDLDAKIAARDDALQTWRSIRNKAEAGAEGSDAEAEARAREQYFYFTALVDNALVGISQDAALNATRGVPIVVGPPNGVLASERYLRMLMGLPAEDGRLLRPRDEPIDCRVDFDWPSSVQETLVRRPELRRQRWVIKQKEAEMTASRNYLLPELNVIGLYRWRGFGNDLLSAQNQPLDSAFGTLFDGNFQESTVGVQYSAPLGFRRAMAAVRNAELALVRDRALLAEQELQVSHQVSASFSECDRAYHLMRVNYNRRMAAGQELVSVREKYNVGTAGVDAVADAQARAADAVSAFHRSRVDYAIAVANVHYRRGSIREYNHVMLNESAWPEQAYADARRQAARWAPSPQSYVLTPPGPLSRGQVPDEWARPAGSTVEIPLDAPLAVPVEGSAPVTIPTPPPEAAAPNAGGPPAELPVAPAPPAPPAAQRPAPVLAFN